MNSRKSTTALVLLFVLSVLLLCSCNNPEAVIAEYADEIITISGLKDEEFTITPKELLALECVSRSASGATAKAGTVGATGPLLETFLAQYDCVPTDFNRIRFIAYDEYKISLRNAYLTDYEVIMSVSSGDKPLSKSDRPLRLLIPGAESNMWIYGVVRIEFEWKE